MNNPNLWNQLLVWPILNLLIAFYKLVAFLGVPGALGFAIVLLTIAIRLLLAPLMGTQLRSAKKMQELKPHLDALTQKHKDDKSKLQQAQLELYRAHGVNPAAGCLPMLVQLPVLIALYNVFYQVLNNGNLAKLVAEINSILYHPVLRIASLDLAFLGTNLAAKPSQWQTHGWWLLSIPLVTGLLQWYQTKLMTLPPSGQVPSATSNAIEKKEEKKPSDMASEMQKQMAIMSPIMFAFFAYQFPVGLALYWNVFGLFGIIQQQRVNAQK